MKTPLLIVTLFLTLLFSCTQSGNKKITAVVVSDTLRANNKVEEGITQKQVPEEQDTDSINLVRILDNAIRKAEKNINSDRFKDRYTEMMPDSSYQVEVDVKSDFIFTSKKPHLVIRRKAPNYIYIDIFSKKNDKFYKVASHEEWDMTYVNDTIRDINGDGLKDFVVNWYGSSGCCLKAFSNVYLLRADGTFSSDFEFINPTFAPEEKIIRGVCYGHPGETEMYKYKWRGENVDTLEYVSYQKTDKGINTKKIIISSRRPYGDKYKTLKILNSVPAEYKKINGYDWFVGDGYD